MWWINKFGSISGPYSDEQIRKLVQTNRLTRLHKVSQDKMAWTQLDQTIFWKRTLSRPAEMELPETAATVLKMNHGTKVSDECLTNATIEPDGEAEVDYGIDGGISMHRNNSGADANAESVRAVMVDAAQPVPLTSATPMLQSPNQYVPPVVPAQQMAQVVPSQQIAFPCGESWSACSFARRLWMKMIFSGRTIIMAGVLKTGCAKNIPVRIFPSATVKGSSHAERIWRDWIWMRNIMSCIPELLILKAGNMTGKSMWQM